uniref:Uncharacterized protein n=1 Tax=Gouania willdenowi TaxID=441366 RepID=A0A8C5G5A0_GOUWI
MSVSSEDHPAENLEFLLTEILGDGKSTIDAKIRESPPQELGDLVADCVTAAVSKKLKDKELVKQLGFVISAFSAQLKYEQDRVKTLERERDAQLEAIEEREARCANLTVQYDETREENGLLQMRVTYLEEAEDQVNQLITENKELEKSKVLLGDKIRVLEHDFDTTTRELDAQLHESNDGKKLLLEAEGAIKASKAKTKLLSRELDAERERVNDLLQQVADGKVATAKVQRQLNLTRRELLDARRELGHALSSLSMSEADGDPDSDGEDATRQVLRTTDPPVRPRRLRRPRDASADPPIDGGPTPARPPNSNRPSNRDLDKIARNIPRFEPKFDEPQNARAFLRDIDFYLKSYPMANVEDKIYLIKATSSRLVNDFIERQLPQIRNDYTTLCRLMVDEFSDALHQTGFDYAHTIKQGKNESPQQYY